MDVEAARLIGRPLDLEPARGGVRFGCRRPGFGGREPAPGQAERVPAQSEAAAQRQDGDQGGSDSQGPAQGRQGAEQVERPHGKAFRSSSKWGPSRREVQSPPQTIAVPCRAAAALKAAAMRGYSGQSQRT